MDFRHFRYSQYFVLLLFPRPKAEISRKRGLLVLLNLTITENGQNTCIHARLLSYTILGQHF